MYQRFSGTSVRACRPGVLASVSATLLVATLPWSAANAESRFAATAFAAIESCPDAPPISGFATLKERASDEEITQVDVYMQLDGLGDGERAVHIHESGSCEPCSSAGGHFDPGPAGASNPDANHPYHLGDLVNIESRGDRAVLRTVTSRVTLTSGPLSVFDDDGSAFIVHEQPDTYCTGGEVAGCAGGGRAACGILRRASEDDGFRLLVSVKSKRERASELDGAEIDGKASVFLEQRSSAAAVESVDFFVDGRQVAHDDDAPFDLGGTESSGKSRSIDSDTLTDGTHVVAARINLESGERAFVSAAFTVDNDKKRFVNGSEND